jgi:hypothetical protein
MGGARTNRTYNLVSKGRGREGAGGAPGMKAEASREIAPGGFDSKRIPGQFAHLTSSLRRALAPVLFL